jgi:hypothetical protein
MPSCRQSANPPARFAYRPTREEQAKQQKTGPGPNKPTPQLPHTALKGPSLSPCMRHEACGTLCWLFGGGWPQPHSWWCCFVRQADTQICQGICISVSSLALPLCLLFVFVLFFIFASLVQHGCTDRSHCEFCFLTFSSLH